MKEQIVELAKNLIKRKTNPDDAPALEEALEFILSELKGFTIERFDKNGTKSALIYTSPKRPEKFKVILNGHLDVIPAKEHQYKPTIKGDRLYGAGALDMKSNVACLVMVFKETVKKVKYPLGLQLVTDEEIGGFNGTKYQVDQGVRADFVIAGETTNFRIVNKAKGVLWVKISSKGKTAHGAYPWRGKNAISEMAKFLNSLEKAYPIPAKEAWVTTVNVSKIETTNDTFNKIPDDCTLSLDIRYIPEDKEKILSNLKKLMPKGFKLEIVMNEPALIVSEKNNYLNLLREADRKILGRNVRLHSANGSSDARHFTRVGGDGVEFGPVGGGIGSDNEWTSISGLGKYYSILKDFLLAIK